MSDNTTPTPNTDEPPAEGEPTEAIVGRPPTDDGRDHQADDIDHDGQHPSHEAAKWRRKLRDTETELGALREHVQALQRQQIDAHVTAQGVKPEAVWASGVELSELVAADGTIDPGKVKAAIAATREKFGLDTKTRPRSMNGLRSGALTHQPPRDRWSEAFKPQR